MIEKKAEYFTEKLVSKALIKNEDKEVYQYGIEVLISTAINIVLLLVIGITTRTVLLSICYFLILLTVRTLTGGYHATSHIKCKILSCFTYITIVYCMEKVTYLENLSNQVILLGVAGIIMLIDFFIPITKEISGKKWNQLRKQIILREAIWIIVVLGVSDKKMKGGIFLSFVTIFVFMIIGKIENEKKVGKVVLERTVILIKWVALKTSEYPSSYGFYEIPVPEKLKNRTKQNS